jgi:hypothetical protein
MPRAGLLYSAVLHRSSFALLLALTVPGAASAAATAGGPLGVPLPLFPSTNWWNTDVSAAPVDPGSSGFISHVGVSRQLHPDLGGIEDPIAQTAYGIPYVVVNGNSQPKLPVRFQYWDESDGSPSPTTHLSQPFYPIPDEAKTQPYWIEGGPPGSSTIGGDRHMLIVDRDNNLLYELYALRWTGSEWTAGSGARFDMNTNTRRTEGWTSADAAGLAILPGLLRYDEVYGTGPINHAFRFTVRDSNGYVFPASHNAGSSAGALPMGARLRLKASKVITGYPPEIQRIFQAMKTYGLIVADNGSDMYITGTHDTRWPNLNAPFGSLTANDFEVVKLGWEPTRASIADASIVEGQSGPKLMGFTVTLSPPPGQAVTMSYSTAPGTASAGSDYINKSGTLTFAPGQASRSVVISVLGDAAVEPDETFTVTLSSPVNATFTRATATGTIVDDDTSPPVANIITQYRVYYGRTNEHLYTADTNEYNTLGANGWVKEGATYRTFANGGTFGGAYTVPFYRLYNSPTVQHHWTTDANEVTTLAALADWSYEGIASYVLSGPVSGAVPLHRLVLPSPLVHLWTIDTNERDTLTRPPSTWRYEGIPAWVLP